MKPPPFLPSKESKKAKRMQNLSFQRESTAIHTEVAPAVITPSVSLREIGIGRCKSRREGETGKDA
jgi:hypothetical protein